MLSRACKYAIRATIHIALQTNNKKVSIKEVAKDLKLSPSFLAKILQTLSKNGILLSIKGPGGGFVLAKPADKIIIIEIIEIMDGLDNIKTCIIGTSDCQIFSEEEEKCTMHGTVNETQKQLYQYFKKKKISDYLKKEES